MRLVFLELLDRIQNAMQERQILLDDRFRLLSNPNHILDSTLFHSLRDVDKRLANYLSQLVEFHAPPKHINIHPQYVVYHSFLHIALGSQKFLHEARRTLAQLPSLPANTTRRTELSAVLGNAIHDFQRDYFSLRDYGPPPSEFDTAHSSLVLRLPERIKLEALYRRHRLQRLLRRTDNAFS
ncbi:hypothetical protein CVT24_009756 [Panaeolus cyanescens]|uniref:Uncharacterized protein n=1 Tax=Panaeolus cyanescens TaxID=181874 RepID=A0A409WUB3_9AGAR|nr:hypothetical protein CVT24_009756 [Panaeolus cyanescens]